MSPVATGQKVMLSHPHAGAVATGLAMGLADQGRLSGYLTGVSAIEGTMAGRGLQVLASQWPTLRNRLHRPMLAGTLRAMPATEMTARILGLVLPPVRRRLRPYDLLFVLHDRAVARARWPRDTRCVYAYEDGACDSFRRAERLGVPRIWDLPTPFYSHLRAMWVEEMKRTDVVGICPPVEPAWKIARKNQELELASAICVASAYTAASLPDGASRRPILIIPYGFPCEFFPPKASPNPGPFLALSVGSQSIPKGTHYLLRAWKAAALKDARLRLVGPLRLDQRLLREFDGLFEHVPHLSRSLLKVEYQAADMLVFPTLGDGFGLVIQEAMCSATPVLTTSSSGGPECVSNGTDGWIVAPRDVDALVDRLRFAAANRDRLFHMGQAARRRAEQWTWADASRRLVSELSGHALL